MATLQLFKLLGIQCTTVSESPSRSPLPPPPPLSSAAAAAIKSPPVHLRRRVTLKKLLSKSPSRRSRRHPPPEPPDPAGGKRLLSHNTLRDLFVSSPPATDDADRGGAFRVVSSLTGRRGGGLPGFRARSLRQRLMRRAWRPELLAIPE